MKRLAGLLVLLTLCGTARAQKAGSFGGGVALGDPTGLTVKYWTGRDAAIDAGVGFSGDAALYADYLWHFWDIPQPAQGKAAVYVGAGPRLETARRTAFAIRTLAGLSYWMPRHPIELFVEAGPVFRLEPDRGVDADFGLGVRFYFRP